jgi:hypothetical protein
MENKKFRCNAQDVLNRVEDLLEGYQSRIRVESVCEELNIFDFWDWYLSKSKLLEMRQFLKEAIKLGYTGYVCFQVGAKGFANGMWAYTANRTPEGHSPKGCPTLYRSFTPAYRYWDVTDRLGSWDWDGKYESEEARLYNRLKTIKDLEAFIEEHKDRVYRK